MLGTHDQGHFGRGGRLRLRQLLVPLVVALALVAGILPASSAWARTPRDLRTSTDSSRAHAVKPRLPKTDPLVRSGHPRRNAGPTTGRTARTSSLIADATQPAANPLLARESSTDLVADTVGQARQLAMSSQSRVLILSSLTETTSTYANPDGSYSYLTHDGLVRLPTTGGGWAPIDTLLQPLTGGRVGAGMNVGHVSFSNGESDRILATASPADTTDLLSLLWGSDLPTGVTVGDTTTYPQVRPGVDLIQKALPNGFEFSFRLLTRPTGAVSFTLPLQLPTGWSAEQAGDAVVLRDAAGQAAGAVGSTHSYGLVSSLTGGQLGTVSTTQTHLSETADGPALVITPDADFLAAPTTLYPVTVDPQISLADQAADTTVDQGQPNTNFGSAIDLIVGGYNTSPTYIRRAYLNFDTSGIKDVAPADIVSASIGIVPEVTANCTNFTVEVWNSNGLVSSGSTFANQPGGFTSHWSNITLQNIGTGCGQGQVQTSADMTPAATAWAGNGVSQYAIALKTTNETNTSTWAKLFSANYSGQHPYIGVIYNGVPLPVGSVTAIADTNSCQITWHEDGSNSHPFSTEYRAEEWIGSSHVTSADQRLAILNPQSATFTGLNPATTYTFKIYETNQYGDSKPTAINCQPGGSIPTAPQNVTASAGDASVGATWAAPANDGTLAAVTGYSVQLQTAAGTNVGLPATVTAATRTYTFDTSHTPTPVNGTSYRVAVTAQSSAGSSAAGYSGAVTAAGVPSAPTLQSVAEGSGVHPGTTDMKVTFALNSDGGGTIDYCRADALSGSTVVQSAYGYGADCGGPIDIPGLAYNTTYTFRVAAHNGTSSNSAGNGTGWSPYSNTLNKPTGQDGSIVKTLVGNPSTANIGDTLTYKITVTAPSSNPLIVSEIRDVLPAGLRAAKHPAAQFGSGGTCLSTGFKCEQYPQSVVVAGTTVLRDVVDLTTTGTVSLAAGILIGAGQSYDITFPVAVTGDNSGLAGLQNRACQTLSNTAQLFDNYAGSDPNTTGLSSAAVVATGCGAGLGTEPWWSYVHTAVGVQADAAVNVANGNLVVTATDGTAIQGHGHVAQVTRRVYNSQDTSLETLPGSIGKGWQLNLGMSDGLADTGVTGVALRIPTISDVATLVTNPLGITLVDRDGTRHSFTPRLLDTALNINQATGALAAAAPEAISVATGRIGCVDLAYDPPAGVHVALWRYLSVASSNSTCDVSTWTMTGTNAPVVAGYAAIRPDRLRTEYDATGQLLMLTDQAGSFLKYSWNSLHQLTQVTEGPCAAGATCRSTTFTYTSTNTSYPAATSNSELAALGSALGRTATLNDIAKLTVTDPANRPTTYTFVTSTLGSAYPAGVRLLTGVQNPGDAQGSPRDRIDYHYQGDAAGTACGASPGQLCSITDERANTTTFGYDAGSTGPLLGPARIISIRDRRRDSHTSSGYPTTLAYNDRDNAKSTSTTVTWQASGNGADPSNSDRQALYSDIDSTGRVAQLVQGPSPVTSSNALHSTRYTWDTAGTSGSTCGSGKRDNNLCTLTRVGSAAPNGSAGQATADETTSWRYDDAGMVLQTNRVLNAATSPISDLITTNAYTRQWVLATGTTAVDGTTETDQPGRSTATPVTPALVLYTLADRTSTVTPRGNAGTAANYRTSYTVDNLPTASPNSSPGSGTCTAGQATGNTGLICSTSRPYAGGTATTSSTYDSYGALLTRTDADGNTTRYGYYPDSSTDLSGTTSAGGWLKTVTDASGAFVAFGYDAAGNTIRTWDRTATSDAGLPTSSYPSTLAAPPTTGAGTVAHADTSYGTGSSTNAAAHPWRWQLSRSDNLGNTSTATRDAAGNVLTSTNARGNATVMTYDENNEVLSVLSAANAALTPQAFQLYGYDAYGDRVTSTDPASAQANNATPSEAGRTSNVASRTYYDAVGRPVTTYTVRQTGTASTGPAPCVNSSSLADPMLPGSALVCTTSIAYDSVDNTIWTRDAAGNATSRSYDPVHRLVQVISPAVNTNVDPSANLSNPITGYVYDADGNTTTVCQPRQFTEYGGGCADSSTGDVTHTSYDAFNRAVSVTRYRSTSTSYTSSTSYDAAGNLTRATDGNGHATSYSYDVLNRRVSTAVPRDTNTTNTTSTLYDPSGSVIANVAPGATTSTVRVTGMRLDADHRTIDTVTGLQVTLPSGNQSSDAGNRAALNAALDTAVATGTGNTRSRQVYDADGNVVASYSARAFTSTVPPFSDSSDPNQNSNAPGGFSTSYMTRIDYDRDDRSATTWTARSDSTVTDPLASSLSGNEAAQCTAASPTTAGLPRYPAGVRLCTTSTSYDADGRTVTATLPTATASRTGRIVTNSYLVDGLLASTTSPAPSDSATSSTPSTVTTSYGYDGAGRQTSINEPVSAGHTLTTVTDYSPAGTVVTTTPPAGPSGLVHWTKYTYNTDGQLARTLTPRSRNGTVETDSEVRSYTADGLLAGLAQPGATTALADLRQTTYGFDNAGNITSVLTPSGSAGDTNNSNKVPTVLTYTYDNLLLTTTTPTDARATQERRTTKGYDPAGRLTSVENDTVLRATGNAVLTGTATSKSYAPNDRLLSETGNVSGGDTRTYTYDADGNRTCAVANTTTNTGSCSSPATGATTLASSYYLDGLTRTVTETHPTAGRTSSYSYDGSGHPIAWTNNTGRGPATSTVTRNDAGLPVSQLSTLLSASAPTTWTYNDQAQPLTQNNVNGTKETWTYNDTSDDTLLSTGLASPGSSSNNLANYTYSYDEQNRILSQTHTLKRPDGSTEGPTAYRYGYDPAGRQTTFVNGNVTLTSTYDRDNNRLTYGAGGTNNVQTSTYNADDSIATYKPNNNTGTVALSQSYDTEGNLSNDGCNTTTYTGFNETATVAPLAAAIGLAQCNLAKQNFSYDPLGRQAQRTNTTPATATVLNPGVTRTTDLYYQALSSTVLGETNSGGVGPNTLDYTLAAGNMPIANTTTGTGASTEYLTDDGNGSTGTTTSSAGTTSCTLHYTPAGENIDDYASASHAPSASPCSSGTTNTDKQYRGERRDDQTGNYQLGSRTYSPGRAGFTTADTSDLQTPFGSSTPAVDPLTANTYAYVNGDPVNLIDPSGHKTEGDYYGASGSAAIENRTCNSQCVAQQFAALRPKLIHVSNSVWLDPRMSGADKLRSDFLAYSRSIRYNPLAKLGNNYGDASREAQVWAAFCSQRTTCGADLTSLFTQSATAYVAGTRVASTPLGRNFQAPTVTIAMPDGYSTPEVYVAGPGNFVKPYEVGNYDDLKARSKPFDDLDIHHVPQAHPAGQVIEDYDPQTGTAIAVPRGEHQRIPTVRGVYEGTGEDLILGDLQSLVEYTNAPDEAISELRALIEEMYRIEGNVRPE